MNRKIKLIVKPLYKLYKGMKKAKSNINYIIKSKRYGIDMTLSKEQDARLINADNRQYQPLFSEYVKPILDNLIITESDKILDYGSGKGIALIFFAKFSFGKISGIELMPELHEAAVANISKKGYLHISSINIDACSYADIDEYNYFFFCNPFGGAIMSQVINNISESLHRVSRHITVIYQYPQEADQFISSRLFPYIYHFNLCDNKKPKKRHFVDVYSTHPLAIGSELKKYIINPS